MRNNRKPKKVIDLNNGVKGSYVVYSLNSGKYSKNGTPKDIGAILPFIDRGVYDGITSRAKESILSSSNLKKRNKLIKKLKESEL